LHVEIIKHIQAGNEQHKFQVDLHKCHDILNVGDYFIIQIKLERYPSKTSHKLQVSSDISFKVLQMIESNSYIIKLPLNFDINLTFDMKDLVVYKIQQAISDAPFDIPITLY
jgi:hypothetical protein